MPRRASSSDARARRRVAIALSLALHVVVLLWLGYLNRDALAARRGDTREVVKIEHLTFDVRPPHATTNTAPTRPLRRRTAVVPRPRPAKLAARALVTPRVALPPLPEPRVAPATPRHLRPPVRQTSTVPAGVAYAPSARAAGARATSSKPRFSDGQIAAIERSLGDAIASDRGHHDPLAVAAAAPETVHRGPDFGSLSTGDRDHHGLCSPVKSWNEGGFDYYYVECNVRFSDGTFQRQSVPWPVRFKPDADPFDGTAAGGELAPPLPGWHLAAGTYLSPELREYAENRGVEI